MPKWPTCPEDFEKFWMLSLPWVQHATLEKESHDGGSGSAKLKADSAGEAC